MISKHLEFLENMTEIPKLEEAVINTDFHKNAWITPKSKGYIENSEECEAWTKESVSARDAKLADILAELGTELCLAKSTCGDVETCRNCKLLEPMIKVMDVLRGEHE